MLQFDSNFWKDKIDSADFFGRVPDNEEDRGLACLFYDVSSEVRFFFILGGMHNISLLSVNVVKERIAFLSGTGYSMTYKKYKCEKRGA